MMQRHGYVSAKTGILDRLLAALPDALTALFFLAIWLQPRAFGDNGVRNGMLIMLVEFILVHASGFLGAKLFSDGTNRSRKLLALLGFGLFYLVFIAAFSWSFKQWWPFVAFAWLMAAKFVHVLSAHLSTEDRKKRMATEWGIGVLAYLLGVFATSLLPVPRLGITAEIVRSLDLPGTGLWISEPQRVIAFGVIYFGILAWTKSRAREPSLNLEEIKRRVS